MGEKQGKTPVARRRCQQVLKAIDRIAAVDGLAFLTTRRVSRESGIADGVLFRHFSTREAMLEAWVETRALQLGLLLQGMPAGRAGLMHLIRHLLESPTLLGFVCCQPMDTPNLRQQLESTRALLRRTLLMRIELLSTTPIGIAADVLNDHLLLSIYRAWNPDNPGRNDKKESLMNQLPWEKEEDGEQLFPSQEALQRLALNDSGFIFDPVNGRSFTANEVGLFVLRQLQQDDDIEVLMRSISETFDVSRSDADRDITEFAAQIRKFLA